MTFQHNETETSGFWKRHAIVVRVCDVVKWRKPRRCDPGKELEKVPIPLLMASEEEPPLLVPAHFSPLCLPSPHRAHDPVSLPAREGIRFVLEG